MNQQIFNKKKCVVCNELFVPLAPNQKTCGNENCKRKLHNQRIQRYRKGETELTCKMKIILELIGEAGFSFHELEDRIEGCKNKRSTLYYALNQLKREGRVVKYRGYYSLVSPILRGEKTYSFGNEYLSIGYTNHSEYTFELFMGAENYSWDSKNLVKVMSKNNGISNREHSRLTELGKGTYHQTFLNDQGQTMKEKKKLTISEMKEGRTIAIAAHIEIWAMVLANLVDARLQPMDNKYFKIRESAINTLLHGGLFFNTLVPPGIRTSISPGFTEILTLRLLMGKIKQPGDIASLLEEIIFKIENYLGHVSSPYCNNISEEQYFNLLYNLKKHQNDDPFWHLCESCPANFIRIFVTQDMILDMLGDEDIKSKLGKDVLQKLVFYAMESKNRYRGYYCARDLIYIKRNLREILKNKDVCRQIMRGIKDTIDIKGSILPIFYKSDDANK